jgi:CHAT domain-containing protein/tetratricopeptide (TPR) repeat protein
MPPQVRLVLVVLLLLTTPISCSTTKPNQTTSQNNIQQTKPTTTNEQKAASNQVQDTQAEKKFLQEERKYRALLKQARAHGNKYKMGATLNNLGNLYNAWNKYDHARDCYLEAISCWQSCGEKDFPRREKTLWVGIVHAALGGTYPKLQQYDKAAEEYDKAAKYFREAKQPGWLAGALGNLGISYSTMGKYEEAAKAYEEQLKLVGDPQPTHNPNRMGAYRFQIVCMEDMGRICSVLGRNDEALNYASLALKHWQGIGDRKEIGATYLIIATAYLQLMLCEDALENCNRSLQVLQTPEDDREIFSVYTIRIGIYSALEQYDNALLDCERSRLLAERGNFDTLTKEALKMQCETMKNGVELLANPNSTKQLASTSDTSDMGQFSQTLIYIQDFLRKGRYKEAEGLCQREQSRVERIQAPQLLTCFYRLQSECYIRNSKPDRAITPFKKAVAFYESYRNQIKDPAQFGLLQQSTTGLYQNYAQTLIGLGRNEEALSVVEQGRAQGLVRRRLLNQSLPTGLRDELRRRETAKLTALQRSELINQSRLSEEERAKAEKRVTDTGRALETFQTQLYRRFPQFQRLTAPRPKFNDFRTFLKDKQADTLYLEFSIVDDLVTAEEGKTTLLFAFVKDRPLRVFSLPLSRKRLQDLVTRWRELPNKQIALFRAKPGKERQDREAELNAIAAAEPEIAAELYSALFGELEKTDWWKEIWKDRKIKHLVVVADGPLLDLPFAALVTQFKGADPQQSTRLIDRFALSTAVSLDMLTWKDRRTKPQNSLLVVANPPACALSDPITAQTAGMTGSLQEMLTAAKTQIKHASRPKMLDGTKAQEPDVKKEMASSGHLLFATHGFLRPDKGLTSFLLLAPGIQEDGILEAREIAPMALSAEMAGLWACHSGEGQSAGGDGLLGLAWAFRAAGCPSIVASQWEVEVTATAALMEQFYTALNRKDKQGGYPRKDDALREAMLTAKGIYKSPYFWAAFQVFGDTSPAPFR